MSTEAARPLDDIRVIDLTIARAGPMCVRQLSDWGADVIRVESPVPAVSGTDANRHGSDFQNLHRNKRSMTLDLKSTVGLDLFLRLVATADIVVENMRPPVKDRLGIGYEHLRAVNPRIIYGSISGFGQDGPYAERGGVDQIAQGLGGLMSVTGTPESGPMRVGIPVSDLSSGLFLAVGILAALHERERSGQGQWVRTSLLESMVAMLDFQATRWTIDGEVPAPEGNHHPTTIPMGCYATADGSVNVAGYGGQLWRSFCEVIDRPDLAGDSRFDTASKRSAARAELNVMISERMVTQSTSAWVAAFNAKGVPAGPVNTIDEVFADPQVRHLQMVAPVEHATLGTLGLIRTPVTMSRTASQMRTASPEHGEQTTEVLAELGLSAAEIADLRRQGVI